MTARNLTTQIIAGVILTAFGAATLVRLIPPLADYAYAIVWWGFLLLIDALNTHRHGLSLWRGKARHFLLITAPMSVLLWTFYELLNLPSPQWQYVGRLPGIWPKTFFGVVAFSTVIPIMVEFWWLLAGPLCLPAAAQTWFRRQPALLLLLAAACSAIPFLNPVFWFNQGIWVVPALAFLPFAEVQSCSGKRFWRGLLVSPLLAGLAWEALNFPSRTHWEYLILNSAPHLFYMPLPGYTGFIPFALSALAVYEWQLRLRSHLVTGILLYGAALGALYLLTISYLDRRIWLQAL